MGGTQRKRREQKEGCDMKVKEEELRRDGKGEKDRKGRRVEEVRRP